MACLACSQKKFDPSQLQIFKEINRLESNHTMSKTTFKNEFPNLAKICDAAFFKKATKTSITDGFQFISENPMCQEFLNRKNDEVGKHIGFFKQDIHEFFQTREIQDILSVFKKELSQKKTAKKVSEKTKQAIIQEYLKEQEDKKREAEERVKLAEQFANTNSQDSSVISTTDTNNPEGFEDNQVTTMETTTMTNSLEQINEKDNNKKSGAEESLTASSEETVLQLDDFYQMFTAVVDQDLIIFKNGNREITPIISFDQDLQKIVVQFKSTPSISIIKKK